MLSALDRLPDRRGAPAAVFIVAALVFGAYSVGLGADANWDLHNYHWYNPYALLNGRLLRDIAPAGMQTYFHPGPDLPFYLLVTHLPAQPRTAAFLMALPHAASALFVFLIARRLLPPRLAGRTPAIAAVLAIGTTGAALLTTLGGTMNDYLVAPLAVGGLYAALRGMAGPAAGRGRGAWMVAAGLALGAGTGLKLTLAPFGLAVAAAVLCAGAPWRIALRALAVYLAAAALAFAAAAGPWMIFQWRHFGSPLFPQFNDILRSPYAAFDNFRDIRWFPATALEWLAYPYQWAFGPSGRVSEWPVADPRLLAALAGLAVAAAILGLRRPAPAGTARVADARDRDRDRDRDEAATLRRGWRMAGAFIVVGYAAWLVLFSYLRYAGPLELLSGLPIVGALFAILPARRGIAGAGAVLAAAAILAATQHPRWQRLPFGETYFTISVPPVAPNSLVLVLDKPLAYVLPFMPADARFVTAANDLVHPDRGNLLSRNAVRAVAVHAGPFYMLEFVKPGGRPGDWPLPSYGLRRDAAGCRPILDGDMYGRKQLCPLHRIAR